MGFGAMRTASRQHGEWVDGFLFVANQLALDFLNTKPVLDGKPRELLPNPAALERWLVAAGLVTRQRDKKLLRTWRSVPQAKAFLQKLIAFRELLHAAILRLEAGSVPEDAFLAEVNALLRDHPQRAHLSKQGSKLVLEVSFEPRKPADVWAPIIAAAAELVTELKPTRIRKCESEVCTLHFYDSSKKGSRRWCSMNICGNKLKVAAYQRRRRLA
jgi:predicted RNA-binding Zn ribbon-like protein